METLHIAIPKWNITEFCGYKPLTTFWQDFSIADKFGNNAIEDTFRRVKAEWKDNYKFWTELCLVLNHKIWQWHEMDNRKALLYDRLWREADGMTAEWTDEQQVRISPKWYRCIGLLVPRGAEAWYRTYRSDGTGTKVPIYTLSKGAVRTVPHGTLR